MRLAGNTLHSLGHEAGVVLFEELNEGTTASLMDLGEEDFWGRLTDGLRRRGWGTLSHRRIHPGLGLLSSGDWAEAQALHGQEHPGCGFTTGILTGFLGRAAGRELEVTEVACRGRGADECRFAFGSHQATQALNEQLLDGVDLDQALAGF